MKYQPTSATPQRPAITPPSGVRGVEVPTYRRNTRRIDAFLTLFLLSAAASLQGQLLRPDDYLPIERLPRAVQSYQQVLGDRLRVPGKERVISSRTLTDSRGTSSAILSWELPGRLRLDRPGSASRVLQAGASGLAITSAQANLSEEEENLVDSLLHDRLETFLINAAKGQLVRLVAQNVRATRDLSPNYAGPRYDVYDQVARVDARASSPERLKRFFIDSRTGQLFRVVYHVIRGGKTAQVETIFTQWTTMQGQSSPQVIERRHDGIPVFTYRASSTNYSGFAQDNLFERPQ